MLHKEILNKNEFCYVLLSSYNEPNILIPIKGIIKDIKFDYDEPNYLVRIEKFYDNMTFINRYVKDMFFYTNFDSKNRTNLGINTIDNIADLNRHLEENAVTIVSHNLMTFETKGRMFEVFDKIHFYFLMLNFFNLKENLTRSVYRGSLKFKDGKKEFFDRLENFIGDKFPTDDGIELKDIIRDIEQTKPLNSLKYEKIKSNNYIKNK